MDELYIKLEFKSMEDWKNVTKSQIIRKGGHFLISNYSNDIRKLLIAVYKDYDWKFEELSFNRNDYFKSIDNQKKFMDYLYNKFKLKSLDDWLQISRNKIISNGGQSLVFFYYNNDMKKLLSEIYPHHHWQFDKLKKFNSVEYFEKNLLSQQKFMDQLFYSYNLRSLDYFLHMEKKKFILNGGKGLLKLYNQNQEKLLSTIYPNYPWKLHKNLSIQSIKSQHKIMTKIFEKLKLSSLDDWLTISISNFFSSGGQSLYHFYQNNFRKLLSTIYPNHPWKFDDAYFIHFYSRRPYISNIENQKKLMEIFKRKLNLNSMDDWLFVSKFQLIEIGGKYLLSFYSNDMKNLLQTIYPDYHWRFDSVNYNQYHIIVNQTDGFNDFQFNNDNNNEMDNNINNNINNIIENNNNNDENNINNNNENKNDIKGKKKSFRRNFENYFNKLIEKQREIMDELFKELNLKTINDWVRISRSILIQNNKIAFALLQYYSNDRKQFLSSIYPNFPFNFLQLKNNQNLLHYFYSIENQQIFMDTLFRKFHFKTLSDWLKLTKRKLINNGGTSLLLYYSNDLFKLFQSIYPNYPWQNEEMKINPNQYFKSIENQRLFMEYLFDKLELKSLDDWVTITNHQLALNGGRSLILYFYQGDMKKLLTTIYPNYQWKFGKNDVLFNIDRQREMINKIEKRLKINHLDDWLKVSKSQMKINLGGRLLKYYSFNIEKLLKTIYPNHIWRFDEMKFRPYSRSRRSLEFINQRIKSLQKKYLIKEKKDWFRLTTRIEDINLYSSLKKLFPSEKWKLSDFQTRSKKVNQRLLFIFVSNFYSNYLILENYRHPLLINYSDCPLEFDIFITQLDVAIEYQGEQHFDDIPQGFAYSELYKERDEFKEKWAYKQRIKLLTVPYWWDQSPASFYSSLQKMIYQ